MWEADLGGIGGLGAVRAVRRRLVDQLHRWGKGELVDDAALALSELVTNAVLHGAPPIRVGVNLLTEGVRLEVPAGRRSLVPAGRRRARRAGPALRPALGAGPADRSDVAEQPAGRDREPGRRAGRGDPVPAGT